MGAKHILWYGEPPQPGVRHNLDTRGFEVIWEARDDQLIEVVLANTVAVVLSHANDTIDQELSGYRHLPMFIDHGILIIILAPQMDNYERIRKGQLTRVDAEFPWKDVGNDVLLFLSDLRLNNFDNIVSAPTWGRWHRCLIKQVGNFEPIGSDGELLIRRAFPRAEEVRVTELAHGFTGSRVFMAYEKRLESSIAHWTQPKLIKIGSREDLHDEVGNMREVSPFVPFELRPNLEAHIAGFKKSILVADFVDRSEPLIDVARAGRAETAISNLFNRTLHTWRERAWSCGMAEESLADAAERHKMMSTDKVCSEYLDSPQIRLKNINVSELWNVLKSIRFRHRAASIHADLHGDNVRVRGDDAILIDLGSVKGKGEPGLGAPLSFDVAMLEVALVFTCERGEAKTRDFCQPKWEEEVRPYYKLEAILKTRVRESVPEPESWMFGCIQRVRAFGIYDQSNELEYAIALAIAMLRWCKFKPSSPGDKGRRVVALEIAAELIREIAARGVK